MKPVSALLAVVVVMAPASALAYVGPGAGLSLLGALWALLAAFVAVLVFLVAWPLRRLLRRRTAAPAGRREPADDASGAALPQHDPKR